MSDKYTININMPIDRNDLISEIKALKKTIPPTKKVEEPQEEVFTLSSLSKKKKDKKKKKKKNLDLEMMSGGELNKVSSDEPEDDEFVIEDSNLIDIEELFREEEDDIGGNIIDEQKKGYEKLKKDENPYKKEFSEELTILYNLLDETNKFGKKLDKMFEGLEKSKTRGVSKYINDLIMSILNSKQSKLSIVKEISNIKKTVADLKIKSDAKADKKAADGTQSTEALASTYFKNVLKYGRGNFVKEFSGGNDKDEAIDDLIADIERVKSEEYSDDQIDKYQQMIEDRLESEDNPFRSHEGSKYIEYENRGVKIYIKKCVDTGEWEFIAMDKDMQQILDYPVPTRRSAGKIKFSDDGRYATDGRSITYKVIEYFLPDEDE